jgi:hypothetical protein
VGSEENPDPQPTQGPSIRGPFPKIHPELLPAVARVWSGLPHPISWEQSSHRGIFPLCFYPLLGLAPNLVFHSSAALALGPQEVKAQEAWGPVARNRVRQGW